MKLSTLNNLITTSLVPVESQRDQLISELTTSSGYVGNTKFSSISQTLISAQNELNVNGTAIVGFFINSTGDSIYGYIVAFSRNTVAAVEYNIANCRPLYSSVSTLINTTCIYLVSIACD